MHATLLQSLLLSPIEPEQAPENAGHPDTSWCRGCQARTEVKWPIHLTWGQDGAWYCRACFAERGGADARLNAWEQTHRLRYRGYS